MLPTYRICYFKKKLYLTQFLRKTLKVSRMIFLNSRAFKKKTGGLFTLCDGNSTFLMFFTRVPSCTQQEENPPWTGVCWHVARPLWESETTNDQIWIVRVWLGATQVTPRVSHGTKFLVSKFFSYYPHMKSIYRNFWFIR